MKSTGRRKQMLVGVCGLAAMAVLVDRVFLLPASATAGETTLADGNAESDKPALTEIIETPVDAARLRKAIEQIADRRQLQSSSVRADLFEAPLREVRVRLENDGSTSAEPFAWPRLTLSSVVVSGSGASAVINDRIVRLGGRIEDATLVEIGARHAVVRYRGAERRLDLPRPNTEPR